MQRISVEVAAASCRNDLGDGNRRGVADRPRERQSPEERQHKQRMGDLRSFLFRATIQPAKRNRSVECRPTGPGVVGRDRARRWSAGSNAPVLKRCSLRNNKLEHHICYRRRNWTGNMAL